MPGFVETPLGSASGRRILPRLCGCSLSILLGGFAAALLLALAGGRPVLAAPPIIVNEGESIQAAIDAAADGDTILINAGHYTESLTLNKTVSLTGVSSATVIIHAVAGHRVLTATTSAVDSSVVISGLSLTGGDETFLLGLGGGLLVGPNAQPRLVNLRIYGNASSFLGGGVALNPLPQVLVNVVVQSNTTWLLGGGLGTFGTVRITGGRFAGNSCTLANCNGGGLWSTSAAVTGTQFISNSSLGSGAGLFVSTSVTLTAANLAGNTCFQAGCLGGGVFTSGTVAANNTQFISNTSRLAGGGAFALADMTLNGGRFERNACVDASCFGGALQANNLVLTGTTLISNSSQAGAGGAIALQNARLSGGLFQANACLAAGCYVGGLRAEDIFANGTHFVGNHADGGSGGAHALNTAAFGDGLFQDNACLSAGCTNGGAGASWLLTLTNTDFIRNTAGAYSGAGGSEIVHVTGGLFEGNRCMQVGCAGGGLTGFGLNISGTQFISNSAGIRGGAIAAAHLGVANSLFERNACTEDGCVGGALAGAVGLTIQDSQLISNTARLHGGAAHSGESALVIGSLLQGNTCTQAGCNGGGLSAVFDGVWLNDTDFIYNSSQGNGGGAYVEGTTTVLGGQFTGNSCAESGCNGGGLRASAGMVVSATAFLGNRAGGYGGGLSHQSGTGRVVNTLFARNSAGSGGAALHLASSDAVDILYTTIASPTLGASSAIEVITGTVQIIDSVFANYSVGIRRLGNGSVYEDYNLFFGVPSPKVGSLLAGSGVNDLPGDPRFVNPASDDYHLRLDSAAMDNAADISVTKDFDLDERPQRTGFDRGYDEYVDHPQLLYLPLVLR